MALFDLLVPTSLERRRERWFHLVEDKLLELEAKGVDLSHLAGDEGFVTIVIEASKAALGTHLEEKIEILARCVQSAALPQQRDDFMSMRLLGFVEELTPEHMLILQFCADPAGWFDRKGIEAPEMMIGSPERVMEAARLPVSTQVRTIVLKDLADRDLSSNLNGVTVSGAGVWQPLATDLGRELLAFIQVF